MHIRKFSVKDTADFKKICLITANACEKSECEQNFLLNMYCNYYIENEPDFCIALADGNDVPVGYLLCSSDFSSYLKNIRPYIKTIRKQSFVKYIFALGEIASHMPAAFKYKAHMHIDILPEYTSQGYGSLLISEIKRILKESNIRGLMLVVSKDNGKAVRFYQRNGFKKFLNYGIGFLMTLDLR